MTSTSDTASAQQLEEWDDRYVWHPFTPHSVYREEEPLTIVAGEGNYLIDAHGNRYLDGVSSIWCSAFGHRHPKVNEAIKDQLDKIAHSTFLGHSGEMGIKLAKRLVELAPDGIEKVFFSDNGSTASEIALKMVYQYWGQHPEESKRKKRKFLALTNAYNGDTIGAVSVGGIDLFHGKFREMLFETVRAPSSYCYRCPFGKERATCHTECLSHLCALIEEHADTLAAVVMEPGFQGAGGMIMYPPGFLAKVREVTQANDVFLILDEVAAGMGRTGKMFACEHENVTPDFLCIAKMLTNGYTPLAATLTTQRVFDGFLGAPEEGRTFYHGHTFTGNALGAAAAIATLDIFEQEHMIDQLPTKSDWMAEQLERFRVWPQIGDIRHHGLAAGLELVSDPHTRQEFPPSERRSYKICRAARKRGVFLRPIGDVLIWMPPLSITYDEMVLLADAMEYGLRQEFGSPP